MHREYKRTACGFSSEAINYIRVDTARVFKKKMS
jgi:hypothetical protein